MERRSEDIMVWPHVFTEPSMDQGQSAFMSQMNRLPWLVGVDGRVVGGLQPYAGNRQYGDWPNPVKTGVIKITAWTAADLLDKVTTIVDAGTYGTTFTWKAANNFASRQVAHGANSNAAADNLVSFLTTGPDAGNFTSVSKIRYGTNSTRYTAVKFTLNSNPLPATALTYTTTAAPYLSKLYPTTGVLYSNLSTTSRDIPFIQYCEIRKSGNNVLRGFIVSIGGKLVYVYKDGTGGNAFTGYVPLLTESIDPRNYKLGVTYSGKVGYVVGSSLTAGTASFARAIWWHPLLDMLVSDDMGPTNIPLDSVGTSSFIKDATATIPLGRIQFGGRFIDTVRNRYGAVGRYTSGTQTFSSGNPVYCRAEFGLLSSAWTGPTSQRMTWAAEDYTDVEIFSTISGGLDPYNNAVPVDGAPMFLRNRFTVPADSVTSAPSAQGYSAWYIAGYGGTATYTQDAYDSLSDFGLVGQQTEYDAVAEYVQATMPAAEDICWYAGTNFILTPTDGFLDIRWTNLQRAEYENFPPLNAKRTNIRAGDVAHFRQAGDFLWVLGDGESYRIQKIGFSLSIHKKLENYRFVGPRASVAVGSDIYAVTTTGLVVLNSNTGQITQISQLDRIIQQRWLNNLGPEKSSGGERDYIYMAYDSRIGAIYIWNRQLGECFILWITTGRVTMLVDVWMNNVCGGWIPNTRSDGTRAFWISEDQGGSGQPTASLVDGVTGARWLVPAEHLTTVTGWPNLLGFQARSTAGLDVQIADTDISWLPDAVTTVVNGSYTLTRITYPNSITINTDAMLCGGTLFVQTGDGAGLRLRIIGQNRSSRYLFVLSDVTSTVTTSTYVSFCPMHMAVLMPPLGSHIATGDMTSRRVVDALGIVPSLVGSTVPPTMNNKFTGLIRVGISRNRYTEYPYDTPRAAKTTDPETYVSTSADNTVAFAPLPWVNIWTGWAGVGTASSPYTYPNDDSNIGGVPASGLYGEVVGDGNLLYPSIEIFVPRTNLKVLAVYAYGRIAPNERIDIV